LQIKEIGPGKEFRQLSEQALVVYGAPFLAAATKNLNQRILFY
jgi:hypothetical protein